MRALIFALDPKPQKLYNYNLTTTSITRTKLQFILVMLPLTKLEITVLKHSLLPKKHQVISGIG